MRFRNITKKTVLLLLAALFCCVFLSLRTGSVSAERAEPEGGGTTGNSNITPCGDPQGDTSYTPSIDLGCKGKGNSIMDLAFAIIRFLSYGVGLVIVGSMTYAGIQYIGSRGEPNAHAMAIQRIQTNVLALFLFLFAFAIVNYLIPGALLK